MRWTAHCCGSSLHDVLRRQGYAPHLFRSRRAGRAHLSRMGRAARRLQRARDAAHSVLESCGFKPGTGGVAKREVEIFPKQNSVPTDGSGSMFILPFAGKSEPIGEFEKWNASNPVPVLERPAKPERVATDAPSSHTSSPRSTRYLTRISIMTNGETSFSHYMTQLKEAMKDLLSHTSSSARSGKYDPDFLDNRVWPYAYE
jgi:hypothetical protein